MYEAYLRAVLDPLGVYDLSEGTVNRAELAALGEGMDKVAGRLGFTERELLTATAGEVGLRKREALFARRPVAATAEARRAAIAALLQVDGDSLTPPAINRTLQGCGIQAAAQEMREGKLRVVFPDVVGIPEGIRQIERIVLDILPCHLEVEFYFRYLTWNECHQMGYTWAVVEAAGHTWESFQKAVPPENG